jgi:nucleoid-associated protein YejK
MSPLIAFISSIFVAVITSVLTVRLALKRFYTEKNWERKNIAYTAIIESLHHVRNRADTNLTFALEKAELPEAGSKELTEKLKTAMAELRKQIDIGNFVIADDAVQAMNELMVALENSTHAICWEEHLEMKLSAVDQCLQKIRNIARRDLMLS